MKITFSTAKVPSASEIGIALTGALDKLGKSEDRKIADTLLEDLGKGAALPAYIGAQECAYLQNHAQSTWAAYLIYRYKFQVYPKLKIVTEFPTYVLIEPVSSCNFRCPMCFQVDKSFTRKPFMGTMSMNLFRQVIDEACSGGAGAVTIASRGEPTLHPKLAEMLEYASGKFFELKLNTNASKLSDTLAHAILKSGVTNLVFSVDAHHKSLYERIRVGGVFEDTVRNIENFQRIRAKHYPDSLLTTRISGVSMLAEQKDQEAEFTKFWSPLVDEVALVPCEERWDVYNNPVNPENAHPCSYIWERFYVWFDGTCNPCDVDYKSKLSPGKLGAGVSIKDVWNNGAYASLRHVHFEQRRGVLNPCDRCGV